MDNQPIPVVDAITDLSDYLIESQQNNSGLVLNALPNYLKTIGDFIVENRKVNNEKQSAIQKFKIANRLIDVKVQEMKSKERISISAIESNERICIETARLQTKAQLAEIAKDLNIALESIHSRERIEIESIERQAETTIQLFDKYLTEQKRQFNIKIKNWDRSFNQAKERQNELRQVFNHFHAKVISGNATNEDHRHYDLILTLRFCNFGINSADDVKSIFEFLNI